MTPSARAPYSPSTLCRAAPYVLVSSLRHPKCRGRLSGRTLNTASPIRLSHTKHQVVRFTSRQRVWRETSSAWASKCLKRYRFRATAASLTAWDDAGMTAAQ